MFTDFRSQGEKILLLRFLLGFSQKELCDLIGLSQASLTDMERGKFRPSDKVENSISNIFGVSRKWFDNDISPIFLKKIVILDLLHYTYKTRRITTIDIFKKVFEYFIRAEQIRDAYYIEYNYQRGWVIFVTSKNTIRIVNVDEQIADVVSETLSKKEILKKGIKPAKGKEILDTLQKVIIATDTILPFPEFTSKKLLHEISSITGIKDLTINQSDITAKKLIMESNIPLMIANYIRKLGATDLQIKEALTLYKR